VLTFLRHEVGATLGRRSGSISRTSLSSRLTDLLVASVPTRSAVLPCCVVPPTRHPGSAARSETLNSSNTQENQIATLARTLALTLRALAARGSLSSTALFGESASAGCRRLRVAFTGHKGSFDWPALIQNRLPRACRSHVGRNSVVRDTRTEVIRDPLRRTDREDRRRMTSDQAGLGARRDALAASARQRSNLCSC
jgi:hypothetical protein